ncbi:hypothetical protein [Sphingomonas sp.]
MNHEPNWRERADAANWWIATAVMSGAFVSGLISAVRWALF